jgi:hypothetical protein
MTLRVVKVPVHDTGIGREAGYENDAALIAAHEREMAQLDPAVRTILERMMTEEMLAVVCGNRRRADRS